MSLETFLVRPSNKHARPAVPSELKLHGLDRIGSAIQIRSHLTFKTPASPADTVEKLKTALSEALELYPPVNGTVVTKEDDELAIMLDDAHLQATPLIVETRDAPYTGDSEDLSPRQGLVIPPNSTIFTAKVTMFSCGTMVIASSMNHQVCDLRGFLDFVELWAQLTRGEPADSAKIPDDWTRTPGRFFTPVEGKVSAPAPFLVGDTSGALGKMMSVPSTVTRWRIPAAKMAELKRDLSPNTDDGDDAWISTGDALVALVSGAITRAREAGHVERVGRSPLEQGMEVVAMAADGRERAPRGDMANGRYFGNFNNLWSIPVSRADLASPTPAASSRVAVAVRKGIDQHLSPQAVANRVAFFDDPDNLAPGRVSWAADIILTNWCKFDLEGPKLDFGWGKPTSSTDGSGTNTFFPPAYSVIKQQKDSGDVILLITVEVPGGDALKTDVLLTKYGTLL
ncbi:transferase [Gongronella butleri]|nr:transferase [Gongronella butleri]